MGLAHHWHEVERMYARVNQLFGDIVKVTPSSKVVGDMALFLLVKGMTPEDVLALPQDHDIAFPDSVVDMFAGSLGTPLGGWPPKLQRIILRSRQPLEGRPGGKMPPADFEAVQAELRAELQREVGRDECLSYLLYPKVFLDFARTRRQYSDVSVLPTPTFFYGMKVGGEIAIHLEPGKILTVKFLTVGDPHPDGTRTVFFELNGQPRRVDVRDRALTVETHTQRKAEAANPHHVGAPTPGLVTGLFVQVGAKIKRNDKLISLEAMKMQNTIYAPADGTVSEVLVKPGQQVEAKDLCLVLE
jgi:pyruvate carboxylase